MEWIQKWTAQIRAQLSKLTVSQKLLIGTLLVVIPIMLLLVVRYASTPQMAPVLDQPMDPARLGRVTRHLDATGVAYRTEGNRVLVPIEQRRRVAATLAARQMLPEDTSAGFGAIVESQSWWRSSEQNRQMYDIALQNELARVLRENPWARDATVIISRPRERGFGATTQRPTASVNVVMERGRLDQRKVNAIAGLISGAVAEMRPEDVVVVDALAGRQWKPGAADEMLPTDYLELVGKLEQRYEQKINDALNYIDGLLVAVNVQVDLTRKVTDTTSYSREDSVELLVSEHSMEQQTTDLEEGGQPGVRSNTGATIAGAGGEGRTSVTEESETTFEPYAGRTHVSAEHPGGVPTRISATVNLPRSFFVGLFNEGKGEDAPEPTDEALAPLIEERTEQVRREVAALISSKNPGEVVVGVYPDDGVAAAPAAEPTPPVGEGVVAGSYAKSIGLGVLALVSLGMMMLMVRKAAQRPRTPTAEELAGIPPSASSEYESVGEAGEADPALAGVEVDDETLRHRKLTEQVSTMVESDPAQIATLIQHWSKGSE